MRRTCTALALLLSAVLPAGATSTMSCQAEDKSLDFSAEAIVSRGVGEGFMSFTGELKVLLKAAPPDFRSVKLASEHLTQHWLYGRELKLRVYREREGDALHGYAELVVEARSRGDADADYAGAYSLTLFYLGSAEDTAGRTLKARGRVFCSVG